MMLGIFSCAYLPSFLKIYLLIYLFLAALGLHCCPRACCGERGLLFSAVRGLLIAVASLAAEHRL